MKTRLLSALLIFLLVASVSIPAVSAEVLDVPREYYELHNLCVCNESEDLGKTQYVTWGIGYSARVIDLQNDKWEIFIHAGTETMNIIITPETTMSKLITLKGFVTNVDECRTEIDHLPDNAIRTVFSGGAGSALTVGGALFRFSPAITSGLASLGYSAAQIEEFTKHFNNAKNAQKNAEALFGELKRILS